MRDGASISAEAVGGQEDVGEAPLSTSSPARASLPNRSVASFCSAPLGSEAPCHWSGLCPATWSSAGSG